MIQRIQSVFLLAVAVLMIALLFVPIWGKNNGFFIKEGGQPVTVGEGVTLTAWYINYTHTGKTDSQPVYYIGILAIVTACVAGYSIFQYNNRRLQMIVGAVNSFLIAATVSAMLIASNSARGLFSPSVQGDFLIGFYLGWGAFVFNILANRFIRRDERLVQSADRIR
jgi:hypothetical protein